MLPQSTKNDSCSDPRYPTLHTFAFGSSESRDVFFQADPRNYLVSEANSKVKTPLFYVCPPIPGPLLTPVHTDYNVPLLGVQMPLRSLEPLASPRLHPHFNCYCSVDNDSSTTSGIVGNTPDSKTPSSTVSPAIVVFSSQPTSSKTSNAQLSLVGNSREAYFPANVIPPPLQFQRNQTDSGTRVRFIRPTSQQPIPNYRLNVAFVETSTAVTQKSADEITDQNVVNDSAEESSKKEDPRNREQESNSEVLAEKVEKSIFVKDKHVESSCRNLLPPNTNSETAEVAVDLQELVTNNPPPSNQTLVSNPSQSLNSSTKLQLANNIASVVVKSVTEPTSTTANSSKKSCLSPNHKSTDLLTNHIKSISPVVARIIVGSVQTNFPLLNKINSDPANSNSLLQKRSPDKAVDGRVKLTMGRKLSLFSKDASSTDKRPRPAPEHRSRYPSKQSLVPGQHRPGDVSKMQFPQLELNRKSSFTPMNAMNKRAGSEVDAGGVVGAAGRRMTRISSLLLHDADQHDLSNPNLEGQVEQANRFLILDMICCSYCRQTNNVNEYSNLIENHRLARIVTLIAVLAILGLVLTYIMKSALEPSSLTPHSSLSSDGASAILVNSMNTTTLPQLRL